MGEGTRNPPPPPQGSIPPLLKVSQDFFFINLSNLTEKEVTLVPTMCGELGEWRVYLWDSVSRDFNLTDKGTYYVLDVWRTGTFSPERPSSYI